MEAQNSGAQPTLEQLLAAGVHFGHQTRRWNPKMRQFICAEQVLFVCTKPQLSAIVRAEAERSGSLYITERWLGGLLTNVMTVKKQIRRMKELEAGSEAGGDFENYTKKEQLMLGREREKLGK